MKFYRTLQPFQVISFDLDDTLYDNTEVIRLAEQQCIERLRDLSGIAQIDVAYWFAWKQRIEREHPQQCEDVTQWRIMTIRALLQTHRKSAVEIEGICTQTIRHFLHWRHKITLPQFSVDLLNRLKSRYKLAVITNGNVDPLRLGLNQFDFVLRGGEQGRAKPHRELFHLTAEHFRCDPHAVLHIGDSLITDVQGAIQAGCQAVWLNESGKDLNAFRECRILPTVEIRRLEELLAITQHQAENNQ
ncbi:HAD-IA family hydrolase [Caviibacterium pharyngocola]|uniref:HAD family hydrolase n=1 Tax=Caviibacterium pharyngocola TaxID=28159 RepID=A0A2M8RXI1_9PAST|nr:HAD-IA family hydrolase [Caviibacterium pharyngocola]PJG83591.1 HAD family hydrolase [Caviibacterium pharyngocola]